MIGFRAPDLGRRASVWKDPRWRTLGHPLAVLGSAALAALLCGVFVAPQGYVLFGAVSIVILIGCLWPWIAMRGLDCQLRFLSTRAEEGEATTVEVVIENRWPWPVWGLAIEHGFERVSPAERSAQASFALAKVSGFTRTQLEWPFVPEVRGRYPTAPPQLVTEFPFGIWKAGKAVRVLSRLIVWPKRFRLPPLMLPCGKQSWVGHPSQSGSGRFGQRTSAREYLLGDSMRQIHWAKTALHDRLISFDRESHAVAEALILLDTHPALHRGVGCDASVEEALRIAASVCDALIHQQIQVHLITHAGHFTTQAQYNGAVALLDWLATLETESLARSAEAERARDRCRTGVLSIHITTDRSSSISADSIVLNTDENRQQTPLVPPRARSWMTIASERDVESQLRLGWQRVPGRRRRAV